MFKGVVARVIVKPVIWWILLARDKNGIKWPWAMNGIITMCSVGVVSI